MLRLVLWAGLVASAVTDESVVGSSGGDAVLPCLLPDHTELSMLEWLRPDLGPEGYLLFYRERREYPHYQHPSFSQRVLLVSPGLEGGNLSVTLQNLTLKDSGTYRCVVRTSDRRTISSSARLEVTETPPASERLVALEKPSGERPAADGVLPLVSAVRGAGPEETPGPGADRRHAAAWTGGALFGAASVALALLMRVRRQNLGSAEPRPGLTLEAL